LSQDEIKAWLQENPGWHPVKEIVVGIGADQPNVVYDGCRRMRKNKKVEYKAGPHGIWLYRVKEGGR